MNELNIFPFNKEPLEKNLNDAVQSPFIEETKIREIAVEQIENKDPEPKKSFTGGKTPLSPHLKVKKETLFPGGPNHFISLERQDEHPSRPFEFYEEIINGLSHSEKFNRSALIKTIDEGLKTISEKGKEGITLELGADHIILYQSKEKIKATPYSGKSQPEPKDVDYIARGTFGLVQKAGKKALKTIRLDKGPAAQRDIENASHKLKYLHNAHPKGKMPNLKAPAKQIIVANYDSKTKQMNFIDGALSPFCDGDLDSIAPDEEANFPDKQFLLNGYANIFDVLAFMHDHDMPHGDLKPGNILIRENEFYLSDFGNVLFAHEWNEDNYYYGTTQYMPIQDAADYEAAFIKGDILAAKKIREKMDVFALAASLFKNVTGCDVYGDLYESSQQDRDYVDPKIYTEDGLEILEAINFQYGKESGDFFLKALNSDREERPSALECKDLLRKIINIT